MAEKGIEIPTVQVDLASGEQLGAAFRKINPDCTVPVLELDDGTRLTEVFAICHYLEEKFPEPALLGNGAAERALGPHPRGQEALRDAAGPRDR